MRLKNIAIILAAGNGTRSGFEKPKQMVKIAGKSLIAHTLRAFSSSPLIDEIIVVTSDFLQTDIQRIISEENFTKVCQVIIGGEERWASSWNAISYLSSRQIPEEFNVIIHDAVRPLVDEQILERVVEALEEEVAVDVVVNAVETVVEADSSGKYINKIPDRSYYRIGQTPQAFRFNVIKHAYELALKSSNFKVTDDCGVVIKFLPQTKIKLIEGSPYNQKLTYREDLAVLDRLFQLKAQISTPSNQIDNSFLSPHLNKVFVIIGGTSGIGSEMTSILKEAGIKVYSLSRRTGVDVRNYQEVEKALTDIHTHEGRIDFVVNSVGQFHKEAIEDLSPQKISESLGVNLLGVVHTAKAALPFLKETQGGFVMFAGSAYTYGRAFFSLYSASKAALVNLTQSLADEWSAFGIKVNCISPERTMTPMRKTVFPHEDETTLLKSHDVARIALRTLVSGNTGMIVDVRKQR